MTTGYFLPAFGFWTKKNLDYAYDHFSKDSFSHYAIQLAPERKLRRWHVGKIKNQNVKLIFTAKTIYVYNWGNVVLWCYNNCVQDGTYMSQMFNSKKKTFVLVILIIEN